MGPFGFLAHPDLSAESGHNASGNYGLLDQIQALNFLRSEIAAFGGNPNHMTVGGQSAGSASALDMMYSPLTDGMIVGCIPESGARGVHDPETYTLATSHRDKDVAEAAGVDFLATLNVTSIAELRNISMDTLLKYDGESDTVLVGTAFENVTTFMEPPAWRPVIDGYVLPYKYGDALALDAHSDIPILTGNNADESGASPSPGLTLATFSEQYTEMFGNLSSRFFDLYPANDTTTANTASNAMYRDISRVSTWDWATAWYAGGAKSNVYVYYFTHAPPNQTEGAYHGSELCHGKVGR
ncbi:carboxylesterase protein [Rutstroemia sp. NJR-2017a BBW]|nr:carboxylesterase protein [Rutstroemia sp. NJR-2017a BBW]